MINPLVCPLGRALLHFPILTRSSLVLAVKHPVEFMMVHGGSIDHHQFTEVVPNKVVNLDIPLGCSDGS